MRKNIVVIGAGVGGLSAAIRLARLGYKVTIVEARPKAGGLASASIFKESGFNFDSGPYVLLDKPGLDWAFSQLQIPDTKLNCTPINSFYEVLDENNVFTRINKDVATTAAGFEQQFPGSGQLYKNFVAKTFKIHQQLKPLTFKAHPSPLDMVRINAVQHIPFLLRSLGAFLHASKLPQPVQRAISIWTHVAGQPVNSAPAPMALVPALIHNVGAFYPQGGMAAIPELLTATAVQVGVEIVYGFRVKKIKTANRKVIGLQGERGEVLPADAVIANAAGVGTYTDLVDDIKPSVKKNLQKLPLQSPGVCAYIAVKGKRPPYYLRFKLKQDGCVAFVQPGLLDPSLERDGWFPARILAPLGHDRANQLGEEGQSTLIDSMLQDTWWHEGIDDYKLIQKRTTQEWGSEYNLYRQSMNPVMTASFMLKGRIAHKSPHINGLYLTGSATHPGQWVSFCAISGVLAANCLFKDLGDA